MASSHQGGYSAVFATYLVDKLEHIGNIKDEQPSTVTRLKLVPFEDLLQEMRLDDLVKKGLNVNK